MIDNEINTWISSPDYLPCIPAKHSSSYIYHRSIIEIDPKGEGVPISDFASSDLLKATYLSLICRNGNFPSTTHEYVVAN